MKWIRIALLASVLGGAALEVGCSADRDGTYKDATGAVTLELKAGKASINMGPVHIDGTYTIDGDKITIKPTVGDTSQTMVLTVNSDGTIDGPPGSPISKLKKTS